MIHNGLDDRVRALLKERKMTIKKLCEETGIAKSTMVSSLDKLTLSSANAIKVANVLGVTTDYLLKGIESNAEVKSILCDRFKCIDPTHSKSKSLCCHYCDYKSTCADPCLNHPDKCGLLKKKGPQANESNN